MRICTPNSSPERNPMDTVFKQTHIVSIEQQHIAHTEDSRRSVLRAMLYANGSQTSPCVLGATQVLTRVVQRQQ